MKERGILFSAPMVRALLAGTKTQTRRTVKIQPPAGTTDVMTYHHPDPRDHFYAWDEAKKELLEDWCAPCPYGQPGDRLWVRETFTATRDGKTVLYKADPAYTDMPRNELGRDWPWSPSIHMPRRASRITLEIISVRVERLQDISEADALAEGVARLNPAGTPFYLDYLTSDASADNYTCMEAADSYHTLWESINGAGSWAVNPWVWVVEFQRARQEHPGD